MAFSSEEEMVKKAESIGLLLVKDRLTMKMVRGFYNRMAQSDFSGPGQAQSALAYIAGKFSPVRATFYPEIKALISSDGLEQTFEFMKCVMSYHCFYGGDHS